MTDLKTKLIHNYIIYSYTLTLKRADINNNNPRDFAANLTSLEELYIIADISKQDSNLLRLYHLSTVHLHKP